MGHLLGGSMVGLMVTSSKKAYATHWVTQVCCTQSPCPCGRPLLTYISAGDKQTLKDRSGSVAVGSLDPKGNQSWMFIGRTDAEAEAPILWPPDAKNWLIGKDPDAGKDWRQDEKGTTEDEMVGWHHRLDGHEFEQTPEDNEGQGGLACCSPGGRKGSDTTWWPNHSIEDFKDQGSRVKEFLLLWRTSRSQLLGLFLWFVLYFFEKLRQSPDCQEHPSGKSVISGIWRDKSSWQDRNWFI